MVVVGIMGIIMTMGVPMVWKIWHREPMNQAIKDIVEVCSNARARAILQGKAVDLVIHPKENRFEISDAVDDTQTEASGGSGVPGPIAPTPAPVAAPEAAAVAAPPGSGMSAQLSDRVIIELLDINMSGIEYRDAERARVRFYPNGTSDEMKLVLFDGRDHFGIDLEVTTGLSSVVRDPLQAWTSR